ncbi:MAG: translation initiation factor IF-2 [Ruminococcaceae bacterium]|nr:translation initiation factor IF-2 [Oscillospiraceae bacterium]
MATTTKTKVNSLAKDLGVKGKEIVDLLNSKGIADKTTSATLEDSEISLVLNHFTKKYELSDISAYFALKDTKVQEKTEKKEKAEKPEQEKKTEPKEAKIEEKEIKTEEKAETTKTEAPKKNTVSQSAINTANAIAKRAAELANKNAQNQPRRDRNDERPQKSFDKNGDRPQRNFDKNDRFGKKPAQDSVQTQYQPPKTEIFGKDGFVKVENPNKQFQKPKNGFNKNGQGKFGKPGQRPGSDKDDDYGQSVRQPSIRPIYDKDGRARSRYASENIKEAEVKRPDSGVRNDSNVRLVDIRSHEVDLSKYDERLDNLVPDEVRDDGGKKKQKKGSNQSSSKGAGGRINRNEAAARNVTFQPKGKAGKKGKGAPAKEMPEVKKFTGPITLPEEIMISDLAAKLKITTGEVVKKLLMMGLGMDAVGANKYVDFDTAYLLADEMGIVAEKEVVISLEEKLFSDEEDKAEDLKERSPVVCVMGHVDHGKTSLLDAIRHTNVTAGEAGGITQAIGAYRVKVNGRDITFLDTPGHEAFTAMRARGAKATDIAILVVAADDGIMPQTIEAINHAKAAGITIIVAINKMDKVGANPDAVKQNLTAHELVPEEWGGDTICVPVSALKRQGIDELLEMVLLVADMQDLKANPDREAKGIVIEAKLDKGRGPVATMLVQNGTLHQGDVVIAGTAIGHVRSMCDENGRSLKTAGPSVPVEITGLSEVPEAGDEFRAVENERMARELVEKRKNDAKEEEFRANAKVSLDTLFDQINEGTKELTIIVKADVQGSAEAVKSSLEKLSNDEVRVRVIHSAVGGIKESDVMLADASNAIIVGFNVRPDKVAVTSAEQKKVDIRTYRIIYDCIEEITAAINGMLAPEFKEVVLGQAQVRQTIHVPNIGFIAGSYVQDGKITRNAQIRVVRDGIVIYEDKIASLRRFKDDVKEVAQGFECGIALERFNDIKENDILEAFVMEEIKREL